MITSKQRWGLVFLVFVAVVYLAIYYLHSKKTNTELVEIYFADRIAAAHSILIEKYNKINEGKIKVIPIDFPNDDFSTNERKEVLARSLRGRGDGIDLFAVDLIWSQRFAKWSEPLDKYFSSEDKKRILDKALYSCYYEGELVALPLFIVQGIMYYRQDLLLNLKNGKEIEEKIKDFITWEDFIELGQQIQSDNPYYIFHAADYEGLICIYMEALLSLKPNYFEETGFNFNTKEAEIALQLLVDLVHKYKISPTVVTNFTEVNSYDYYIKNDGLFIRGWQSYDKDFVENRIDPEKEKKLRKAPLPYFKGHTPASVFGGWNLMISKYSNKKEYVVDFIKFLLSDESQELFYKESGYYPVLKNFYNDSKYFEKYPDMKYNVELIKTGVHRPQHVEYTKYSKIMSHYFHKAIKNEMSVKDALAKCTNAIQYDKLMTKDF